MSYSVVQGSFFQVLQKIVEQVVYNNCMCYYESAGSYILSPTWLELTILYCTWPMGNGQNKNCRQYRNKIWLHWKNISCEYLTILLYLLMLC